jgi:hypothetical protein
MRKKDNYQPSSFISVYLLVKIKIKVVYDHEKKAQVTTETYKTYIYVSGNNDLLLLMNSVFLLRRETELSIVVFNIRVIDALYVSSLFPLEKSIQQF